MFSYLKKCALLIKGKGNGADVANVQPHARSSVRGSKTQLPLVQLVYDLQYDLMFECSPM